MDTAREVRAWQGVDTAGTRETSESIGALRRSPTRGAKGGSGWLAVAAMIVVLFGGLLLLVDGTARSPTTFEDVSQLTQAP